jgi:membrane fusion protein (multidrug efflux system)
MQAEETTMADDLRIQSVEIDDLITKAEDAAHDAKLKSRRKKLLLGFAGALGAIALAAGGYYAAVGSHYVSTDNAYVGADTAQINSQVSGQIAQVLVSDTQRVRRGDILAVIDPEDARLSVERAQADLNRTLQRVRQYYAQEANASAQLAARQADLSRAETDYHRRRDLAATGAISQEELTATRAAYDAARANFAAAQQNLEAQRALTHGATIDNHPETASARAALDAAVLSLERTTIRAPIDGVVVQRSAQVGQRIDPGQPLMRITPLAQAYVDANFKEGQLGHVRIGQPVELHSDLYGDEVAYHGRVAGVGGGTGSAFAIIPAQNATGNWIKVVQRVPVRIALDPAELSQHPLRVGLSMEATIDIHERS